MNRAFSDFYGVVTCVTLTFELVQLPADQQRIVEFLCNDEWPFHGRRQLTADHVQAMTFSSDAVASFWVLDHDRNTLGLIQLLDLDDIGQGSPLFDLRIASRYRGQGFGGRAAAWLVDYLFGEYPELHRIEAYTRSDNVAMHRVLSKTGFLLEGTLRNAWWTDNRRMVRFSGVRHPAK